MTNGEVLAMHTIHISTRTTQIAYIAFEIGLRTNRIYLLHYALLAATRDKLALMR